MLGGLPFLSCLRGPLMRMWIYREGVESDVLYIKIDDDIVSRPSCFSGM